MDAIKAAGPALMIFLAGLLFYIGGRHYGLVAVGVVAAALVGAACVCEHAGQSRLLTNPVAAVRFIELRILLLHGTLAGLAVGATLFLAIRTKELFDPKTPEVNTTIPTRELVVAVSGAITAFLTQGFVKPAEEIDAKWLGPPI